MRNIFKLFGIIVFTAVIIFVVTACDNSTGSGSSGSVFTEHGIWYMGFEPGLYPWSSDEEFEDALDEVIEDYNTNNPSTIDDVSIFNGVVYDIKNWQDITGGEPKYVWNAFWKDIGEYSCSVGSCWLFNYVQIPSHGGTGIIYAIEAIVTDNDYISIMYYAFKATLYPRKSKSILGVNQIDEMPYLIHGRNTIRKNLNQKMSNRSTAP